MSNANIPPPRVPPAYTGPGSPRDVPPPPGSFPIDPATLPKPIRDELLAAEPVAIDTSDDELKDGLNRCPKCGATDIRHKPGSDLLICLYCRNEWHGKRVEEEFGLGEGIDQLKGTVIASGARDIAADAASLMSFKCTGCGAEVVRGASQREKTAGGCLVTMVGVLITMVAMGLILPSVGARKPVGAALAAPAAAPAARSPAPRGAGSALGADFRRQMSAGAAEPARTSAATPPSRAIAERMRSVVTKASPAFFEAASAVEKTRAVSPSR
jgi:predicted RNA-binding Zn-ribbon protein involved in translation (DUF1610 family)